MNHITTILSDLDLIHSPDDNGYYFQFYEDGRSEDTSIIYKTKEDALMAYDNESIDWKGNQ